MRKFLEFVSEETIVSSETNFSFLRKKLGTFKENFYGFKKKKKLLNVLIDR